jgi:hypothetical protein
MRVHCSSPMPSNLRGNVEYHYCESGHMAYVRPGMLKSLHDNVADFIRRTSGRR